MYIYMYMYMYQECMSMDAFLPWQKISCEQSHMILYIFIARGSIAVAVVATDNYLLHYRFV